MRKDKVVIVHLRRPKSKAKCPEEMRSDPFWEFGSFGITTCHGRNLMHPDNAESLGGVRLAFAQGGKQGTRLVYLTPPVRIKQHRDRIEARWTPREMPFRYHDAPILVSNEHKSNFRRLESALKGGGRKLEGQFGSSFRSRSEPLDADLAEELVRVYTRLRKKAPLSAVAGRYVDALPWSPPKIDGERKKTYLEKLSEARGLRARVTCGKRRPSGLGRARKQCR
jgi:hypothetical protein